MKKKSTLTALFTVLISQFLTGCGNIPDNLPGIKIKNLHSAAGFSGSLTGVVDKVKAATAEHEVLVVFIVCVVGLLIHFICAGLESRTTGLYYAWGVYGRIKAFFF